MRGLYAAKIEATRRSLPAREVAAAIRALLDERAVAFRALTERKLAARVAWRDRKAAERFAAAIMRRDKAAKPFARPS